MYVTRLVYPCVTLVKMHLRYTLGKLLNAWCLPRHLVLHTKSTLYLHNDNLVLTGTKVK